MQRPVPKGQTLDGSTSTGPGRAIWWRWEGGGGERRGGKGWAELQVGKMESSGTGWWQWPHNTAGVANATELHT